MVERPLLFSVFRVAGVLMRALAQNIIDRIREGRTPDCSRTAAYRQLWHKYGGKK